eukprot:CAMPEP_0181452548 /NCGR_PEP_ID=MMETSP1110-20121109/29263_1 /TAXON_ID=174948 /ORGANISM="Symbiodinium sp., Strain CCMP421" /LENGTH=204 /DNA_ID=CAMNT_0023576833 /DNA_START=244 /DNA_END=858 /DNA_ORIENTATION=+
MTGDERLVREAVKLGVVNDEVRQLALKKLKNKSTIAWAVETVSDEAQLRLAQLKELYETPGVSRWLFISATVAFLVTTGPVIGLKVLGFTATGVVKGSLAATIQSTFPSVTAGAWFAWAQSAAATGTAACWKSGTLLGLGTWWAKAPKPDPAGSVGERPKTATAWEAERDEELLLALVREQRVDYEMRRLLLQRMRTVNPQAAL